MEVMKVISGNSRKDHRGYAESWTSEQLDKLLSEDWLRQMVAEIRAGDVKKKEELPYICPHYTQFRNNHRAQADIIPEAFTFMTCVDVDDFALVDKTIKRAMELNEDEYSDWKDMVLRIEYSARRKVHIYIRIPKGMTIEEAQRAFCKELEVPYDESCITPERFIYVTGKDEEVYRSEHWLEPLSEEELNERREAYLNRGLDVDGRLLKGQTPSNSPSMGRTLKISKVSKVQEVQEEVSLWHGYDRLKRVTLPDTLRYMGYEAFRGCRNLSNIFINCDSVPTLGSGVFADLPYEFRIIVPKTLLKRYREAWPLYAHHIFADNSAAAGSDVLVVTTTEKNTLAKELGLRVKKSLKDMVTDGMSIAELEGNYTDIRKLKVVGPISGADFSVLRYLAGYCPWTDARNYLGRLEYIDLYDAQVEPSDWYAAYDKNAFTNHSSVVKEANVLPYYAFLKAYALKTLILPKTVTTIPSRALLECENLETLVIGDSTTYINWDALDDCVSLTRLYLLPK